MITAYSKKIVNWLINHSGISEDEDQIEIYVYGLECFLNTAITVFILFLWSILTHSLLETFCWIITFIILRHHAGGFHAPTQFTCILTSSLLGISNWLIIQSVKLSMMPILIISSCCIIVCLLLAPIDSTKLILSKKERRTHKIISIFILILGTLASLILPINISSSIMYAFFCTCVLIVVKKISTHKNE